MHAKLPKGSVCTIYSYKNTAGELVVADVTVELGERIL